MRAIRLSLMIIAAIAAGRLAAVEGMSVPRQLPDIAGPLARAGLKLDPAQLSDLRGDPMGAVVAINGCTASFVSPDGLVVTNHHCAYGAIQHNSTPQRNLMQAGFVADSRADELSAGPGARVFVLDDISDVTSKIEAVQNDRMHGGTRFRAVENEQKRLVAECEKTAGTLPRAGREVLMTPTLRPYP